MEIIYEDRDLVVIVKEVGLLSWSPHRDQPQTAERILTDYLRKGNARSNHRAYTVHRLDRDTSGLLVFAKSEKVRDQLKDNWPKTDKRYFAVVQGHLQQKEGAIAGYLSENLNQEVYFSNEETGKWSESLYRVTKETPKYSAVEVTLVTGRKNQIRVHFAHAGHPVVGDAKYGQSERGVERMALHSMHLAFDHPFTGKRMVFDSPPPAELLNLIGE
jgi:tRNA pseudouridine32 synthase/23S rRNA pseudouridine746 synthase/23S rRNA pseudouridine1911/1915/1917 synthase